MFNCQRCKRKTAKGEVCNYCSRLVCFYCIKAIKKTARRDILRIVICKDCWGKAEFKKKYRHDEVLVKP